MLRDVAEVVGDDWSYLKSLKSHLFAVIRVVAEVRWNLRDLDLIAGVSATYNISLRLQTLHQDLDSIL